MVEAMIAGLVFIGIAMVASVVMCFLMTQEYKSQIATLLKQQQKLILMVKAKDSIEAETAVSRMETPLTEGVTLAEPKTKEDYDKNVILAGNKRIRIFGLNPQEEADYVDELRNGVNNAKP